VVSEGSRGPEGSYSAMLFHGDPAEETTKYELFGYQPPKGFRITDMAQLPDGRLLLLNRKFSFFDGLAAKITIADPQEIEPGKVWTGKEITSIAPPLTVDNMEGIAVTQEGDQLFIWIISDDNFN